MQGPIRIGPYPHLGSIPGVRSEVGKVASQKSQLSIAGPVYHAGVNNISMARLHLRQRLPAGFQH